MTDIDLDKPDPEDFQGVHPWLRPVLAGAAGIAGSIRGDHSNTDWGVNVALSDEQNRRLMDARNRVLAGPAHPLAGPFIAASMAANYGQNKLREIQQRELEEQRKRLEEKALDEKLANARRALGRQDVYVPVHGTPEADRLRIVNDRATLVAPQTASRTSRGVYIGPATTGSIRRPEGRAAISEETAAKAAAKVKPKPKKKLTNEELARLAKQMQDSMAREYGQRMAAGPAVKVPKE